MANKSDMTLIGVPIAAAVFATLLQSGAVLTIFAAIGSLAAAVLAASVIGSVGNISILGSGVNIDGWTIKMTFVTVFLTVFYASNVIGGLNLIISMPIGIGIIIFGALTTMYVLGMFGISAEGGS